MKLWLKLHGEKLLWSLAGVVGLSVLGLLFLPQKGAFHDASAPKIPRPGLSFAIFPDEPVKKFSVFDGLPLDPQYEESVVSVMIDNYLLAREQHSGISKASLVYEALAEGGITRLMLIFPYQELSRVGPIRSAREYFVDFAEEYGGIYVHAGGAPSAITKLLNSEKIRHFDEDDRASGEHYSSRDLRYAAPHNLFLDLLLVRERAKEKDLVLSPPLQAWCFRESQSSEEESSGFSLSFSHDPDYDVRFFYDPKKDSYDRHFGKGNATIVHKDQLSGEGISPRNVLIQEMKSELIPGDEKERILLQTSGKGRLLLFSEGKKINGWWEKAPGEATKYSDEEGKNLCLKPGQTWIAIIPDLNLLSQLE